MNNMLLCPVLAALALCARLSGCCLAGELVFEGVYKGQNLYLQNPHEGKLAYCITGITINGTSLGAIPQSTAFELDLSFLKEGSKVEVRIHHKDGCEPKLVNPTAIAAEDSFGFLSLYVDANRLLWEAFGERKWGKYFILKLEDGEWVSEKMVPAKGQDGQQAYVEIPRHNSGANHYRIKYLEASGKTFFSSEITYQAAGKASFYPRRVNTVLSFSRAVQYEIIDQHGKTVRTGSGLSVDCRQLPAGAYTLLFDGQKDMFLKK